MHFLSHIIKLMSNRTKARAIKDLHYEYLKVFRLHSYCTSLLTLAFIQLSIDTYFERCLLFVRYVNWSQAAFGIHDPNTNFYIGNQYSKFWKDIMEVRDLIQKTLFQLTLMLLVKVAAMTRWLNIRGWP